MTADFESYAKQRYLAALEQPHGDPHTLLAGIRYVATRDLPGREWQIRELFDTRVPKRLRREFEAGCVDALVATAEDRVAAGRFLIEAWSARRSPASNRVYESALRRLEGAANEAMLRELAAGTHRPSRVRRMAVLLGKLSEVPPPEPIGAWAGGEPARRNAVLEEWRARLEAAGRLDLAPAGESVEKEEDEGSPGGYFDDGD